MGKVRMRMIAALAATVAAVVGSGRALAVAAVNGPNQTDSLVGKRLKMLFVLVGMALVVAAALPAFASAQGGEQHSPVLMSPGKDAMSAAATTAACTDPTAVCLPDSILTLTFSDLSGVCTWPVTVDWGDGSSKATKTLPAGGSITFSHAYAATSLANSTFYTATISAPPGTSSDPENTECLAYSETVRVEIPPATAVIDAPETVIVSHHPAISGPSATFTYSSPNYPPNPNPGAINVSFECSLDGAPFTACPNKFTKLSNGPHTLRVRAYFMYDPSTSQNPNQQPIKVFDQTPASYSWTVDAIKPRVTTSTPLPGQTGVKRGTNISATFSEAMRKAAISKTTFKLFKVNSNGTETQVTNVTVSLSADGLTANLNPFGTSSTLLAANTEYQAVVTTGATDRVGNKLDQNRTTAGNQEARWTFRTGSN